MASAIRINCKKIRDYCKKLPSLLMENCIARLGETFRAKGDTYTEPVQFAFANCRLRSRDTFGIFSVDIYRNHSIGFIINSLNITRSLSLKEIVESRFARAEASLAIGNTK